MNFVIRGASAFMTVKGPGMKLNADVKVALTDCHSA